MICHQCAEERERESSLRRFRNECLLICVDLQLLGFTFYFWQ
jgi:hypothetical protein